MGKATRRQRRQGVTLDDIRAYLTAQRKDQLVELLMSRAAVDERLREHLELEVASQRPDGIDLTAFRTAIDRAVAAGGDYVDYYAAHGYAHGIGEVVDRIAALLDQDHAEAVIELAEHAVRRVEEAIGWTDDSDGELGGLLEQLGGLHHQACLQARPDAQKLATRLLELELGTEYDTFRGAAAAYADVLGAEGLAAYRRLAAAAWARVPPLGPDGSSSLRYQSQRFRVTYLMEALAELSGDVDERVEVLRRDRSSAYQYLRIAEAYREAGRHDAASSGRSRAWPPSLRAPTGGCGSSWPTSTTAVAARTRRWRAPGRSTSSIPAWRPTSACARMPSARGPGRAGASRRWPTCAR
jgi:hypothetical protein